VRVRYLLLTNEPSNHKELARVKRRRGTRRGDERKKEKRKEEKCNTEVNYRFRRNKICQV